MLNRHFDEIAKTILAVFFGRRGHVFGRFSKSPHRQILIFWILNLHIIMCQRQEKSIVIHFFVSVHVPDTSALCNFLAKGRVQITKMEI